MTEKLSRREFLRWSMMATIGGVLAACTPKPEATIVPSEVPVEQPTSTPKEAPVTTEEVPVTTGVSPNQAPEFQAKVAAGELPEVDKRLPKNPKVLQVEQIGVYGGGPLYQASLGVNQYFDMAHVNEIYMFEPNNLGTAIQPDAAESYEISADGLEVIIHLREGLKWSDGEPFTADDILWWWDVEKPDPNLPHWSYGLWKIKGQDPKVTKIDDFTIKMVLPEPYRPIISLISNFSTLQSCFYEPSHYLKQWHINYNPDADAKAKAEGFDHWYEAYDYHRGLWGSRAEPGCPVLSAFVIKESATTYVSWGRNPYYYAVDPAGNQLPYADGLYMYVVENMELVKAKAMSGELTTFGAWMSQLADMPAYRQNEEKGNYQTREWIMKTPGALNVAFNLTHKDPELRRIFNDIRFRRAMSVAINRAEIIDKLYFGKAEAIQSTVDKDCSFYKEEWGKAYIQYDVDQANAWLDEMGLEWDANKQFRKRADGKTLFISIQYQPEFSASLLELVKTYWEAVGVQVEVKPIQRDLYYTKGQANELDVGVWNSDRVIELRVNLPGLTKFEPNSEMFYAMPWARWRELAGAEAPEGTLPPEEPPIEWQEQFKRMDEWRTAVSDEEYFRLSQEVWQFFSDQLILISLVGYPVTPQIVKNGLMNCPQVANLDDGLNWFKSIHPEGFFWKT